jgi:hypothetical protein
MSSVLPGVVAASRRRSAGGGAPTLPTFVSYDAEYGGYKAGGSWTPTGAFDAGFTTGNLLILAVYTFAGSSSGPGTLSTPSGWTALVDQNAAQHSGAAGPGRLGLFYKTAAASQAAPALTLSRDALMQAAVVELANFNATTPCVGQVGTETAAGTSNCTVPAITTDADNQLILYFAAGYNINGFPDIFGGPSGATKIFEGFGSNYHEYASRKAQATAGTVAATTLTVTSDGDALTKLGHTVRVRGA